MVSEADDFFEDLEAVDAELEAAVTVAELVSVEELAAVEVALATPAEPDPAVIEAVVVAADLFE